MSETPSQRLSSWRASPPVAATEVVFDKEAHNIPSFITIILSKDQSALELVSAFKLASTMRPANGLCT